MKILHVISQYPDSTGSGTYLTAILREAHRQGHANAVVAAANTSRKPQLATTLDHFSLVEFGTSPLPFDLPGMSDVMPYSSSTFKELNDDQLRRYEKAFLQQIKKLIEEFSPDVIHSHHLWLLSSLIKIHYPHIPLITSCHGSDLRQFNLCPHLRERVLKGCRNIDKVLALTESQKTEIIDLYTIPETKIEIVGAGFNDSLFYWSAKPIAPPVTLVYCGKLSRAKGIPWLLKALAQNSGKNYELKLIGEGAGWEKDECLELATVLGHRVTLCGVLPQQELATQLRKAHVFILPSLFEGLPLVILEALACGCRVITTKLPGCIEIFNKVGCDMLHMIDLPRLKDTDVPYSQDEPAFINNIHQEIERVYEICRHQPSVNKDFIEMRVQSYTWQTVFLRIEKCYLELHSHYQ